MNRRARVSNWMRDEKKEKDKDHQLFPYSNLNANVIKFDFILLLMDKNKKGDHMVVLYSAEFLDKEVGNRGGDRA